MPHDPDHRNEDRHGEKGPALGGVGRDVPDRPRVAAVVAAEGARAARDEQLRDLGRVQERPDREVVARPERVEDREDAVLLDELAGTVADDRYAVVPLLRDLAGSGGSFFEAA